MFWIDTFISPNTFLCYNFSFGSIPSPHQVHSIAFLQQHLVGEVKVLIQNFLFHHVLHVGEGWRSRQVFHLERAGGHCFTNISCFLLIQAITLCYYVGVEEYSCCCMLLLQAQVKITYIFTSRPFLKTAGGSLLFWVPSPSPPSPRMFCLISRLLLKLAFWNLACAIYAKTILLKCF